MSFTREDVMRLASLARIELSPDEIEAFTRQLGDILDLARQVQSAETASAELALVRLQLRDDVVQPSLEGGGLFKVPRVIGG